MKANAWLFKSLPSSDGASAGQHSERDAHKEHRSAAGSEPWHILSFVPPPQPAPKAHIYSHLSDAAAAQNVDLAAATRAAAAEGA